MQTCQWKAHVKSLMPSFEYCNQIWLCPPLNSKKGTFPIGVYSCQVQEPLKQHLDRHTFIHHSSLGVIAAAITHF